MNIFEIYKQSNINLKDFLENHYSFTWQRTGSSFKALCPFHQDTKPSLSYDKKRNAYKCMVCGEGGDLINFVEKYENISNIQACKKVLLFENIYFEDNLNFQNKNLEEKNMEQSGSSIQNQQIKMSLEIKKQKELQEKQKAIVNFTQKASTYAVALYDNYTTLDEDILELFPNQSATFLDFRDIFLGYDLQQDSICILNRTHNPNICYNIKHRLKYSWDEKTKTYDKTQRLNGKWISQYNSTTFAFPYEYFKKHQDNQVIICEGEKDALNLLSYNINCLTLGGVTSSWDEHKDILKDKIVYIWFDNDSAGYINALKRYREIEEVSQTTYIVLFFHINNNLPNKYDISDFLCSKKFQTKEDIFEAITYSSYILTNELIDEIAEHIDINIKDIDKNASSDKKIYKL